MTDTTDDLNHVAIIGMAGRFPGASNVETFWENLKTGNESISFFSDDELLKAGVDASLLDLPNFVKAKGLLKDSDLFDASFFGFSPREAEIMDPQHRMFLECAWEALESAGYDPYTFGGRIGVFAGSSLNTYLLFNLMANKGAVGAIGPFQTQIANDKDFIPTRVSYKLNLRGPSVTIQTACSTSLVAVHIACQSLLNGECDIALAGGVSVSVPLKNGYLHEKGGILSSDGHCRAFDADAGGTVSGDGVAIVALRRIADARKHGDVIDAVIRGSAVNNDGSLKVGYTAPSVEGQTEVIAEALEMAGVEPETVGYVEAHGTGTVLGDPIEVAALTRVFRERSPKSGFCAIGSLKSNVGHLDAAAGAAALIKATLALKHQAIPASLHFKRPNPDAALETSPFFVNDVFRPWPRNGTPRRAGVSSFGIGGTNAHVVLEEAPVRDSGGPSRQWHLLPLSAKSASALAETAKLLARHLQEHPEDDIADVAFTLALGRGPFDLRRVVVCANERDAIERLQRGAHASEVQSASRTAKVAFLFPGQGAQYVDMARGLYEQEPTFKEELDRCVELFRNHTDADLRRFIFPSSAEARSAAENLEQTAITQPALFAVEYALARTWISWGVRPRAMIGHSIGEYVAACVAGVFTLEDATALVATRGRLVQSMPRGAMLAVTLPEEGIRPWLNDKLCLAAVNSSGMSVVSGPSDAVEELEGRLTRAGQMSRRLRTSHAFHSPSMEAAVEPFVGIVRKVRLHAPQIPFCSNVTGTWIQDAQATSPEYWGNHLRETVRFADGLSELLKDPAILMLEVGPGQSLTTFARQHEAWNTDRQMFGSLRHPNDRRTDREFLLGSLGALWSAGASVDWRGYYRAEKRYRLRLPTYPFQRQRYWIEPDQTSNLSSTSHTTTRKGDVGDWIYCTAWRRLPPLAVDQKPTSALTWLLLGADSVLGRELVQRFEAAGDVVVRVYGADSFAHVGEHSWTLDPGSYQHYARLLEVLRGRDIRPSRVVHLFSLEQQPGEQLSAATLERAQNLGFYSLLALGQALAEPANTSPMVLDVLCQGVFGVTGEESLQPENATLLGPCSVIPQEVPHVTCRTLDLTGADLQYSSQEVLTAVHDALLASTTERVLARRGKYWWARNFDPVFLGRQPGSTMQLRSGGTYLICGGLGGIGLALAKHLAQNATGPVLALLSRSSFPAEEAWQQWLESHRQDDTTSIRIRKLQELRALGARLAVLQADVADFDQTAHAVADLKFRFGRINGVIHAAGVPASGLIVNKSRGDAARVMEAKTRGTLVLDALCGKELDFFILCSSRTAVLGGLGQSDYCAANAFLDAFAQWKNSQGSPVLSIAWDTWREIGMAADMSAKLGGVLDHSEEEIGHPLLQRRIQKTDKLEVYLTNLTTASSWIINEHRMMGHGLMPGVAYLEMVRAAVAQRAVGMELEFRDVLFTLPVVIPDGQSRTLYTTLDKIEGGYRFRVQSRTRDSRSQTLSWQEHATGSVILHEPEKRTPCSIGELLDRCCVEEVIDTEEELRRRLRLDYAEKGGPIPFAVGPRWKCLSRVQVGTRGLLATLVLAEQYSSDLETYAFHPALMDVLGGASRIRAGEGYYLPFWYGRLRFVRGLARTMHCLIRFKEGSDSAGETLTCDFDVYDDEGELIAQVVDYTMKRVKDVERMRGQIERTLFEAADEGASDVSASESQALSALRALNEGMSVEEGTEVFRRILAAKNLPAQLVVSTRDLPTMQQLAQSLTQAWLAEELGKSAGAMAVHPRPELATPYAAPVADTEEKIAAIWQEVLGVAQVGVNDDFFALGGHSLAAVQIGSKIRSQFGVDLALHDFFERPTVANIVNLLSSAGDTQDPGQSDVIETVSRVETVDDLAELENLSDEAVDAKLREMLANE